MRDVGSPVSPVSPVSWSLTWLGWLVWGAMTAAYQPTLHRFHRSVLWAPCLPAIAAFYLAATIASAVNHHAGRGVAWKGRAYQGAGA